MQEPEDDSDQPAQTPSGRDRRESTRFPVAGWAEVMTMDGLMMVRGQITDISATGCYVEIHGSFDLPLNSAVEMIFRINEGELRPRGITQVVRPGNGAGFAFAGLNSKMTSQIQMLIEVLSGHLKSAEPDQLTDDGRAEQQPEAVL
jgi:hypothetical protein